MNPNDKLKAMSEALLAWLVCVLAAIMLAPVNPNGCFVMACLATMFLFSIVLIAIS
jgi:hypothetical protein